MAKCRLTKEKCDIAQGVFGATIGVATGNALSTAGATGLGSAITGASMSAVSTAVSSLGSIPIVGGTLGSGLTSVVGACASVGASVGSGISAAIGFAASIGPIGWGVIAVGGFVWWFVSDD